MAYRALALASLLTLVSSPSALAAATPIKASQPTTVLLGPHVVRAGPSSAHRLLARVEARRPITGARTTLPVLSRRLDRSGREWLLVRLPGRVLGSKAPPATGWIQSAKSHPGVSTFHLVVDRATRRVSVYRAGKRIRSWRAIVGASSTPTPAGRYFVEENVRLSRGEMGGPYALALSARSSVLQEFAGGPGQIALHGRGGVGGRLGTAVSHGCVRLSTADITWLASRIDPGTPVTIR